MQFYVVFPQVLKNVQGFFCFVPFIAFCLNYFHSARDFLASKLGCLCYNSWYWSVSKIAVSFMFSSLLPFLLFILSRTSTREAILNAGRLSCFCCVIHYCWLLLLLLESNSGQKVKLSWMNTESTHGVECAHS